MRVAIFLGVLLTSSSFASVDVGPNSTWEEIHQAGLWAKFPRIAFVAPEPSKEAPGEKTILVPIVNTCLAGSELKGKTPWAAEILSKPLAPQEAQSFSVPVIKNFGATQGNSGGEQIAFIKTFTPPACN